MGQARRAEEIDDAGVVYPDSDGAPVGETGFHVRAIFDLYTALEAHFGDRDDVHLGCDKFVYFAKGDPKQVVCPDLFVSYGAAKEPPRDTWKTWVEGKFADLVIEVTSRSTAAIDLGPKRSRYERLGVREYVMFDPLGEYLVPRLQLYRLIDGRYVSAGAGDVAHSDVLDLDVVVEGATARLRRPDGTFVLRPAEERARADAIQAHADEALARADAIQARADALAAEVLALRAQLAQRR